MRFWRIKLWWHAYVMGRRVFYLEGGSSRVKQENWRFFRVVPRALGVQAAGEWREMIEQMDGKVTKQVVR